MTMSDWAPIVLAILVAIGGLVLAAAGGRVYLPGLALFVLAVVFGFWSLKRHFDRIDATRR